MPQESKACKNRVQVEGTKIMHANTAKNVPKKDCAGIINAMPPLHFVQGQ